MADPLTIIGSASAIVQLIGGVSSGLRALKDAAAAVKDAPRTVRRLEEKIQHLAQCLGVLERYFQQRPPAIPFERELYEIIQGIERSCTEPLEVLRRKTPARVSRRHAAAAYELWKNDTAIAQARNQIDETIPYLNLLFHTLNLFKADQTEDLLHQIAASLDQTARRRATVCEFNSRSLETTLYGIRTFAKDATGYVVQSVSTKAAAASTPAHAPAGGGGGGSSSASTRAQVTDYAKSRRQLDHEWDQNRQDLERLLGYRLFENAEKIQRRALLIREELSNHHGVLFPQQEREAMQEQLADILIKCKVEGSTEKAVSLLESIIKESPTEDTNNTPALPWASTPGQKRLSLHYKLGVLYKETRQTDLAERELRMAFNAYSEESPKDTDKIRQAGEKLSELYEDRVGLGDPDHRSVLLSQQLAFGQELRNILGQPAEQRRTRCDRALEWCAREGIGVSVEEGDRPRFDTPDGGGSSPLHHAAERCQDELVLQQMADNSDTLEGRDGGGDTPLLAAVAASNAAALAVLLQKGASVRVRDGQRQTPLHRSRREAITRTLLQHRLRRASTMPPAGGSRPLGGDDDDDDDDGGTSRRLSSSSASTAPPAARVGTTTTTTTDQQRQRQRQRQRQQHDADIDIDAQDAHRKTALYLACSQGRGRVAALLLLAGADPNVAAHQGSTPLAIAVESQALAYLRDPRRRVDIVEALVRRGADREPGRRALRGAGRGVHREILRALEGGGAGPSSSSRSSSPWSSSSWSWSSSSSWVPAQAGDHHPDTRRDSGYQPSVSSSPAAAKPQLDPPDLGPDWSSGFDGGPGG